MKLYWLALMLGLLLFCSPYAWAGEAILPLAGGGSASVSQPHVTAELIPESTAIQAGQPFDVALHLHMDEGWHTYWLNPGGAGLPTKIAWTLPAGFSAGPIRWPVPEKHAMGPIVTFGYGGDVYLLVTITPSTTGLDAHPLLKAHATWLVCQEACIPGKGDFELTVDSNPLNLRLPVDNHAFFEQARARLPAPAADWTFQGAYRNDQFILTLKPSVATRPPPPGHLYFFPDQPNVLDPADPPALHAEKDGYELTIPLEPNGGTPAQLGGVLVSDQPINGAARAITVPTLTVKNGTSSSTTTTPATSAPPPAPATPPLLLTVLAAAFLGGLILNLMPCVLPVLSLKVFALVRHAGENKGQAWIQGAAFTAGVVISFWLLAGLLIALNLLGNHLGWGFQMQSPGFILGLTFLFFFLALNLFGLFEIGTSLVGLDARAAGRFHGTLSSFANGALATLAATPCTGPFMGSSLGFAAQQPPAVALLIFTFLALGMACPYFLLTLFPGALRFVPRPGAWMERLREVMGFLLLATVIYLVYVFGALAGTDAVPGLLGALLLGAAGAWVYGRFVTATATGPARLIALLLALLLAGGGLAWGLQLARAARPAPPKNWQEEIQTGLTQGRPVFVDFTAAWCLSCKVNERVALDTATVRDAFARKNVLVVRADWTNPDPAISQALARFNRAGVPLYLVYSPHAPENPQVLPEVLTPGIVLEALDKL